MNRHTMATKFIKTRKDYRKMKELEMSDAARVPCYFFFVIGRFLSGLAELTRILLIPLNILFLG